jgi:hypothetical protein
MHKKIWILLAICLFTRLSAQVTVTENTSERCTFNWVMEEVDTLSVLHKGHLYTQLYFSGQNTVTGGSGEPAIPGYTVLIGVPPKGDISVNFVAEEFKTIRLNNQIEVHPDSPEERQPEVKFSQWISQPVYSQLGDMRTARIVIRPFLYDRTSNTLKMVTRGHCRIAFPPSVYRIGKISARSHYEGMLSRLVCNFKVASGWYAGGHLKKTTVEKFPLSFSNKVYSFKIGDGRSGTNEATINENGILKIPGSRIVQLFGDVSLMKVKLFASLKGELPDTVADEGFIPDGIEEVPLLRVDKNGNGIVDKDDFFLAHVSGASDWIWRNEFIFRLDRYDDYRNYWLTVSNGDGRSIGVFQSAKGALDTLDSFDDRIMYKRSLEQPTKDEEKIGGLEWIWAKLSSRNSSFSLNLNLSQPVKSSDVFIKVTTQPPTAGGSFNISLGKNSYSNCKSGEYYSFNDIGNGDFRITFSGDPGNIKSAVEIKDVQVKYQRTLTADSLSKYTVYSSDSAFIHCYNLRILTDDLVYIFRLSTDEKNVSLVDTIRNGRGESVTWVDTGGSGLRYFICAERVLQQMPEMTLVSNLPRSRYTVGDLRNTSNGTDFIIITHPDFLSQAQELAEHKDSVGFQPVVARVNDVYRFFSGGDTDPTAIRNFVTYVSRNWKNPRSPSFLILMGTGHYDYKGIRAPSPLIPVYYSGDRVIEDYFTYTKKGNNPQLAIGRIPCSTHDEAEAIVRKIKETEDPNLADFGDWRNRALFVADDDMQGDKEDPIVSMTPHHISSDRVAGIIESHWPYIDMKKVYLYEYEWDNAWEKPEASRAIINEINNGVGVVNYFGHGSDNLWADEHILRNEDISSMYNSRRYPVVLSFSCSVGKFDIPGVECLSEAFVKAKNAGAVAAVSSTRLAYANSNENLASYYYGFLFDKAMESTDTSRVGMALVAAKIIDPYENHRTYCVLGDPSIRMIKRSGKVDIVVKNSKNKSVDTIKALQTITISGSVRRENGSINTDYGSGNSPAYVQIGLFNSPDSAMRKDGGNIENHLKYLLPGTPVFQGKTQVRNGKFEQVVLVPRNISFDKPGVKLTAYAWRDGKSSVALGIKNDIVFHGSEKISSIDDTSGPRITIRPVYDNPEMASAGASFTDKIVSLLPLKCEIDFFDESGIDASGTGPDEGLTMEIKGTLSRRNINHRFQFREGDYRRGSATIAFEENSLKTGQYTLEITSKDLLGNLSGRSFTLVITDQTDLTLNQVFNYPNPMRMGRSTRFYFYPSNTAQQYNQMNVLAAIKIYTLSGKVVRVFKNARNGEVWDGRDQVGNLLGPDIYLYQVIATSPVIQKTVKSKVKKLIIHPPR